jgi:PadR family transcriptional regulator PadR
LGSVPDATAVDKDGGADSKRFSCGASTGFMTYYCGRRTGEWDAQFKTGFATGNAQHGYGIARRIEQVSGNQVLLNQGTIYASLVRLQQRGWIEAEWGISENNRKAKFYTITKRGRKQLAEDAAYWQRLSAVIGRVLAMEAEGGKR